MSSKSKKAVNVTENKIHPDSDAFLLMPSPRKKYGLVGHHETASLFCDLFNQSKAPHGFLLVGQQGIGKATFIYHLIRALERKGNALTIDDVFSKEKDIISSKIEALSNGNLKILTRAYDEKKGKLRKSISIDDFRNLKSFFEFKAHGNGKRYIIIDSFDDCISGGNSVPNALLKILEEPPENCYFFILCHREGFVLPTIRSRCRVVRMKPLVSEELKTILSVAPHFNTINLQRTLDYSGGSVRLALLYGDNFWIYIITQIKKMLFKGLLSSKVFPYQKLKDKSFDQTLQASEFLFILNVVVCRAVSDYAHYAVLNAWHDCAYAAGVIFDKIKDLFLRSEEYNFTNVETIDRLAKILDYFHYIRQEVYRGC